MESPTPGPGISGFFDGPYLSYYTWPRSFDQADDASVLDAYRLLYEIIEDEGPFDGVIGFSHGAALAFGFLADHARKNPFDAPLFRCSVFLGAMPPFRMNEAQVITYDQGMDNVVRIPTLHVTGKLDFVYQHSLKLFALCSGSWAKLLTHEKGHEIPKDPKNVNALVGAIKEMIHAVSFI